MLASRIFTAAAIAAIAALAAVPTANAGTVRVEAGEDVEYIADSGEQNNVRLGFGSAFDFATGTFVQGYVVRDSAGITPGPGCRLPNQFDDDVALCDVFRPSTAFVDLRDGNDRAEVDESANEFGSIRHFMDGDLGSDTLIGGSLSDLLVGNAGNDRLEGRGGNDRLEGGTYNDTLLGENGNDTLIGYLGDDTVEGGAADDAVDGGGGADKVHGDSGLDDIQGGPGPDQVFSRDGTPETPHCGLGQDAIDRDSSDDDTSCETPI